MRFRVSILSVFLMMFLKTCEGQVKNNTVTFTITPATTIVGVTPKSVNLYRTTTCGTYTTTPFVKIPAGTTSFVDSSAPQGTTVCYTATAEAACDATVDCSKNTQLSSGNFESAKSNEVTISVPKAQVILTVPTIAATVP